MADGADGTVALGGVTGSTALVMNGLTRVAWNGTVVRWADLWAGMVAGVRKRTGCGERELP